MEDRGETPRRSTVYKPAVEAPSAKSPCKSRGKKREARATEKLTPRAITCLLRSFLSGYLSYREVIARTKTRRSNREREGNEEKVGEKRNTSDRVEDDGSGGI